MTNAVKDLRARYNANGNAIIPNTFQHPNIFVDKLMGFLTPEENVVLTFAVRRILGFQANIMSRKDNISLSQFTDGILSESGEYLSHGCGLGTASVRSSIEALETFKILLPTTEKPDPKKGQEYWLQDNENNIDWVGLEERKSKKQEIEYKRTAKARSVVAQQTVVGQHPKVLSDSTLDCCGTETQNPQKPMETHNGTDVPLQPLPIEWQMAGGVEKIVMPTEEQEKQAKRIDFANWVAMYTSNTNEAHDIAMAFQNTRQIELPQSKVKGQRKAIKEMLEMGVKAVHVEEATKQLMEKGMTVTDLFSVSKTAIDLANKTTTEKPSMFRTISQ